MSKYVTMKTFNEWLAEKPIQERAFLNQLFPPKMPPLSPEQMKYYRDMKAQGMQHDEIVKLLQGKQVKPGEQDMQAAFAKGTTGDFMTPQKWAAMKASW